MNSLTIFCSTFNVESLEPSKSNESIWNCADQDKRLLVYVCMPLESHEDHLLACAIATEISTQRVVVNLGNRRIKKLMDKLTWYVTMRCLFGKPEHRTSWRDHHNYRPSLSHKLICCYFFEVQTFALT